MGKSQKDNRNHQPLAMAPWDKYHNKPGRELPIVLFCGSFGYVDTNQRGFALPWVQVDACSLSMGPSRCCPTWRYGAPEVAPPAVPAVTGSESRELTYPSRSKGIIPDLVS